MRTGRSMDVGWASGNEVSSAAIVLEDARLVFGVVWGIAERLKANV